MYTPASTETLPEIVDFLRQQGARRQFFPAYTLEDFTNGTSLRDLKTEDILVARRGDQIVGVLSVWDQAAYKQDVVESYGPALRRLRPVYDLIARLHQGTPAYTARTKPSNWLLQQASAFSMTNPR